MGNAETGKDLYFLLVRPIPGLESKSRLIIVPDGKLHLLPFSSLPDSQWLRAFGRRATFTRST